MNKQISFCLALAAACMAQTATAQDNLLAEKPVYTLGEAKTWTAGETPLTFTFTNQLGVAIAADKVSVSVSDNASLNGNVLTVTTGDKATLSATYGEVTLTAEVYVIGLAPNAPAAVDIDADKVAAVFSAYYGADELPVFDNWGSTATASEITTDNGSKILLLSDYDGQWGGLVNLNCNVENMAHLHIDIYSTTNGEVTLAPVWKDAQNETPNKAVTLEGGKWNSIDLDLSDFGYPQYGNTVDQLAITNSTVPELAIDNFYFWTDKTNTISVIEEESAPVEYYTVSGVRVNGVPEAGIYIRRQGHTVTKVLVK